MAETIETVKLLDCSTLYGMNLVRNELLNNGFHENYVIIWNKAKSIYKVNFAHPKKKIIIEFQSSNDSLTRKLRNITRDTNLKIKKWRVIRLSRDPK